MPVGARRYIRSPLPAVVPLAWLHSGLPSSEETNVAWNGDTKVCSRPSGSTGICGLLHPSCLYLSYFMSWLSNLVICRTQAIW